MPANGRRDLIRRLKVKCGGTRAETRFRLSAKRTNPFKSAGASVQSITGSRDVRISGSNGGYITLQGSVKSTGYRLHSPVSPSIPLPCVTVCRLISTGLYSRRCYKLHLATVVFCVIEDVLDKLCSAALLYGLRSK